MKRTAINSLAERFWNTMVSKTINGSQKSGAEWWRELGRAYPDLPLKEKRKVASKVVRIIKAAGNPNDAAM